MSRAWLGKDVAAMITLIDDPRHRLAEDGTARLSMSRPRPSSTCAAAAYRARREEIRGARQAGVEIADYLDILRSRAAFSPSSRPNLRR